MEVLAPLSVRAVAALVILLAWLGLVLVVSNSLALQFMSTVSEAALVAEFAGASELPVLAELGFMLTLVLLDEQFPLFSRSKLLTLWLYVDLKTT